MEDNDQAKDSNDLHHLNPPPAITVLKRVHSEKTAELVYCGNPVLVLNIQCLKDSQVQSFDGD
jgi:hypothetical protein